MTASVYSNAALRVAADYRFVDYFPAYEIIAGPQSGGVYYEADRRTVTPAGIAHVMDCFARHYLADTPADVVAAPIQGPDQVAAEIATRTRYLCDEERLAAVQAVT